MSVLYATGWEAGSLAWYGATAAGWTFSQSGITTNPVQQHRTAGGIGGSYAVVPGWSCSVLAGTVTAGSARWLHFWGLPTNPGGNRFVAQFGRGGTCQVNVSFEPGGSIGIYRGSTLLLNETSAWNPLFAHWFAIEAVCDDSVGIVNVYVDGNLAATYSGDTQEDALWADWDRFAFGSGISPYPFFFADMGSVIIDDIIVTDNTTGRVDEHFCVPLTPDGDTAQADFTPSSAGDHYEKVNEIPADDTDYNSATAAMQEDRYTFSDPPALDSILCINVCARATRTGALTTGEISVKSGAAPVVYSTPETLPASPTYYGMQVLLEQDPATSAAWTDVGLAAIEAGFRIS